jgi:hypothetical protein
MEEPLRKKEKRVFGRIEAWAEGDSPEGCLYYGRVLMERAGSQRSVSRPPNGFSGRMNEGTARRPSISASCSGREVRAFGLARGRGWYQKAEAGVAQLVIVGYDLWRFGRTEEEKEQTSSPFKKEPSGGLRLRGLARSGQVLSGKRSQTVREVFQGPLGFLWEGLWGRSQQHPIWAGASRPVDVLETQTV